jgi:hypothetical protein
MSWIGAIIGFLNASAAAECIVNKDWMGREENQAPKTLLFLPNGKMMTTRQRQHCTVHTAAE